MKVGKSRLAYVAVFAVAMAWVEAAVVLYLRVLVNRLQPYQPDPLPHFGGLGQAELIREGATLLMLLAVGWLAGERVRTRLACSAFAFGVWDIFYYVFLIPLTGWPHSLLDWDILFLVPVPWWGPVIAPVSIAALLAAGGAAVALLDSEERAVRPGRAGAILGAAGTALVLLAFMANALGAAGRGADAIREALPVGFPWPIFLAGFLLMAIPVLDIVRRFVVIINKQEPAQ
jgi:hypothetical protein